MLVVRFYRHLRAKWNERQHPESVAQAPPERVPASQDPNSNTSIGAAQADPSTKLSWRIMLMAALAIPVFLETLDYTVVATAQVHIASVFNRLDLQSYIGTIYLLTSTVFLPPFASIADIFGRHSALQLALLFFMVGSAISTGSENMATVLAGRGVAGIGAAGLLAVVRIILTDSGSLDNVNWQQSVLFALYTVGYCLGPFIGGELVSVSFRWIFAINLPCCAVAMVLGFLLLRGRTKGPQSNHGDHALPQSVPTSRVQRFMDKVLQIDWIGVGLFMTGGILLLLALNWGSTEKWDSGKVIACFIVGGILLIVFVAWEYFLERKEELEGAALSASTAKNMRLLNTYPMIPMDVFRSRNICIVQFGTFVSGMIMLVMFYFVAIFFVIVTGLSPTKSGVQLIYFAPGIGGGSLLAIQIIKRTRQPKYAILFGTLVCTIALGLISMGMNENKQNLVNGFMAMAGIGTGLSIGPLAVQARFSQPVERNAVVSALTLFFRSFGGTIGLAQCGAVLNGKVNSYIADLVRSGALSGADAAAIAAASSGSSSSLSSLGAINALPPAVQGAVREAFRQGSRFAFVSLVPWCALAFVVALFLTNIQDERARLRADAGVEVGMEEVHSSNGTPKAPDTSVPNLVDEVQKEG